MKALVVMFGLLAACASKNKTSDPAPAPAKAPVAEAKAAPVAAVKAEGSADSVKCTKGKDERVLEIQIKEKGCDVQYTKGGETKSVASSAHGDKHCRDAVAKIQKRLSQAGYSCQ